SWSDTVGDGILTSTPDTYLIYAPTGVVTLDGNHINGTDDGYGAGGHGIKIIASRSGMRVRARHNTSRNVTGACIDVQPVDSNRKPLYLEFVNNYALDHQLTPTCTEVLNFESASNVATKLVMYNNINGDGVSSVVTGLSSGTWLIRDGSTQEWAGYGAPGMSAPKGSTYQRLDGGASTCWYV